MTVLKFMFSVLLNTLNGAFLITYSMNTVLGFPLEIKAVRTGVGVHISVTKK